MTHTKTIESKIAPIERIHIDDFYLFLAVCFSTRTTDGQAGVGCVITNKNHRIISTGYNGHPPGMDWTKLPNLRPDKYSWIPHAEHNAIKNIISNQAVIPEGSIAYTSLPPCFRCLTQSLWPEIKEVHYYSPDGRRSYYNEDDLLDRFLDDENVNIKYVQHNKIDLSILTKIGEFFKKELQDFLKSGV